MMTIIGRRRHLVSPQRRKITDSKNAVRVRTLLRCLNRYGGIVAVEEMDCAPDLIALFP